MKIAQTRIMMRGQLKVVWVIDWIETIPRLGLGNFDFVGCTGVVHHLKSPQNGLRVLHDAQTHDGGAQFMIYGAYGRTGIYQIQNILRIINQGSHSMVKDLNFAKKILALPSISEYHPWLTHSPNSDFKKGDVGIYDLFLHKRDVSFTISGLYLSVQEAGYHFVYHSSPEKSLPLTSTNMIIDTRLFDKLAKMEQFKYEAIAELTLGYVTTHEFYVSKLTNSEATINIKDNAVYAHSSPVGFKNVIHDNKYHIYYKDRLFVACQLLKTRFKQRQDEEIKTFIAPVHKHVGYFLWPKTAFTSFVIESLVKQPNHPRTLKDLILHYRKGSDSNITTKLALKQFEGLFKYIKGTYSFYIRHKSISSFNLTCCRTKFSVFGTSPENLLPISM